MNSTTTSELGFSALDALNVPPATGSADPPSLVSMEAAIYKDVRVCLQAMLGRTEVSVEELLGLKAGSVLKLDHRLNELVELRLNDSLVALGEIVAVDDNFGVRIVEIKESP
jgi:flagellar motor switch protein FliN/FliY